jgi:hypothetical protein
MAKADAFIGDGRKLLIEAAEDSAELSTLEVLVAAEE